MILSGTSGSFSSPFHPRNYPFNQTCSWNITAKQGYRVQLTLPDYNLHGGGNCSCNFIEVQNSFTDVLPPGKLCVCPKEAIHSSGSGRITSTNYPNSNYTAFRNCTWNITAPANKRVKFVFTDFLLSECSAKPCSEFCSYVELYDGGSANSPSLGRFCQGSPRNESQFSTGNQMFVMFHPGLIVDRGFEANYSESSPGSTPSPLTTETTLTSRSKETSASKKSLPPNAVAGIVVGGLIFVPFIVIRVYYYCRHGKSDRFLS
ncbi:bone morphogenetic protein 1-like isoform X2 [Stylophora pistillata]|nr:bone morphogenetic protein 1-like isoform X2 [Stylophora pistillata]